jgi:hypothetical protein
VTFSLIFCEPSGPCMMKNIFFPLENGLCIDSDYTIGIVEFHPQLIRPPPTVPSPNGEIVGIA